MSLLRDADDTGSGFLTVAEVAGHSADPAPASHRKPFIAALLTKNGGRFFQEDGTAQPGPLLEEVALFVGRFTLGAERLPNSPHPR